MTSTVSDEQILDEEWLAAPRSRSRLRLVLAVLLAASLCFLGGALVQKHLGPDPSAAAAGPTGFPGGGTLPGGGQGFPGAGELPGAGSTAIPDGTDDDEDAAAVVGTVVSIDGDVWTVEDLGGTEHKVRVTDDSDVVRETDLTADQVAVGDRVDISGTNTDGQLTAADITLR
jgi:hypothetical protein